MASTSSTPASSIATNKPPYFDGTNYNNWKIKMKIFLQCIDLDILQVVVKPFKIPDAPYTDATRPQMALNIKAMNALQYSLSPEEFDRISMCQTAHEIWTTLETAYEGTNQVKESRINRLLYEYEIFRMNENESIDDMYPRFNKIISELFNLGKKFSDKEKNYKILRSLTSSWQPKVTAIEEAQDLNTLKFEELIGRLRTHEMQLMDVKKRHEEGTALKKKGLALQAEHEKSSSSSSSSESSSNESSDNESGDMAHFARRFTRYMRKKGRYNKYRKGGKIKTSKFISTNEPPSCFGCGKQGHIKVNCPLAKKDKYKEKAYPKKKNFKKAFKATTWDDSSSEDSDHEHEEQTENANMCFMAHSSVESEVSDSEYFDFENMTKEELLNHLEELQDEFQKLYSKYSKIKKKVKIVSEENNQLLMKIDSSSTMATLCENCEEYKEQVLILEKKNEHLIHEHDKLNKAHLDSITTNNSLQETIDKLQCDLAELNQQMTKKEETLVKFTGSTKVLSTMLGKYGVGFRRQGLGYTGDNTSSNTIFVPPKSHRSKHKYEMVTCNYCCKMGHTSKFCHIKNNSTYKYHFVPNMTNNRKSLNSNIAGPIHKWVPKVSLPISLVGTTSSN